MLPTLAKFVVVRGFPVCYTLLTASRRLRGGWLFTSFSFHCKWERGHLVENTRPRLSGQEQAECSYAVLWSCSSCTHLRVVGRGRRTSARADNHTCAGPMGHHIVPRKSLNDEMARPLPNDEVSAAGFVEMVILNRTEDVEPPSEGRVPAAVR